MGVCLPRGETFNRLSVVVFVSMPRQVMSSRLTCRSCCSVSRSQGGGVHQWLCGEEWEAVYNWLFSSDLSLVEQGVGRVAAWRARGEVPMMVELTADLCGCRLQERERAGSIADYQSLLHYSMIITRWDKNCYEGSAKKLRFWIKPNPDPALAMKWLLLVGAWAMLSTRHQPASS